MRVHGVELIIGLFFLGSAASANDLGQRIMADVDRQRHFAESLRNTQGPLSMPNLPHLPQPQINQPLSDAHVRSMMEQQRKMQAANQELENSWFVKLAKVSSGMQGRTSSGKHPQIPADNPLDIAQFSRENSTTIWIVSATFCVVALGFMCFMMKK